LSCPAGINSVEIRCAHETDADDIHRLMVANLAANGGSLSASFSLEQIVARLRAMPMIVACHENELLGFLMTSSRGASGDVPILQAMLEAYPGADDAYVYGPVCVSSVLRGQGLAQIMFAELRRHQPGREGILFVRRDNAASLRAHAKMAMREVAEFTFRGVAHTVFAYIG
jgi:predicted GNAT superfamily acetyltransferase